MAIRRHVISRDDWARPEYGTMAMFGRSPRKQTAVEGGTTLIRNWYPYENKYRVDTRDPAYRYVGKILVPWNGESTWNYAQQLYSIREAAWRNGERLRRDDEYIHEYDIARETRGTIYRILFVRRFPNGKLYLVSKPAIKQRQQQMNLYVDANSMEIIAVSYF